MKLTLLLMVPTFLIHVYAISTLTSEITAASTVSSTISATQSTTPISSSSNVSSTSIDMSSITTISTVSHVPSTIPASNTESSPIIVTTTPIFDIPPPENVSVCSVNISSLSVTWQNTDGSCIMIDQYQIVWESGQSSVKCLNNGLVYNYTISGLTPGNFYNVFIWSEFKNSTSDNITANNYTYPSQPQSIKVTEPYTNGLNITWIQTGSWFEFHVTVNASTKSVKTLWAYVDNLLSGVEYNITVIAETGYNLQSSPGFAQERTRPNKPESYSIDNITTNSFQLYLFEPSEQTEFNQYLVNITHLRDGSVLSVEEERNQSSSITNIIISGLISGAHYNLTTFTVSGEVISYPYEIPENVTTVPLRPENVTVIARGTNYLNISWSHDGECDYFRILVANETGVVVNTTARNKTASLSDLPVAGGLYDITVYAVSANYSNSSILLSDRTNPFAARIKYTNYNSTFITMDVEFPASTICNRVEIRAYDSMNKFFNSSTPVNCSVTGIQHVYISELVPGTFYDLQAVTWSDDVYSEPSFANETTDVALAENVTLVAFDEISAFFKWLSPKGLFDSIVVSCFSSSDGVPYTSVLLSNATTNHTCVNLTSGAVYTANVITILNKPESRRASSLSSNFLTKPTTPQNVDVSTVNSSSLALSFSFPTNNSVAQCSYFDIEWSDETSTSSHNGSFSVDCTVLSHNNSFISVPLVGLYSDNQYLVFVYTVVSQENLIERSYPANDSACTLADAVSNFVINEINAFWLNAQWEQPTRSDNIEVYFLLVFNSANSCVKSIEYTRSANICFISRSLHDCDTSENRKFKTDDSIIYGNVSNLQPYNNYTMQVYSVNCGGSSVISTTSEQTKEWYPGVVSNVTISSGYDTILLTWSEPEQPNGKILNYFIEWKDLNYTQSYGNANTTSLNYVISSLTSFTTYAVTITASTSVGYGEKFYSNFMTQVGAPNPASNVIATSLSATCVSVSWENTEPATASKQDIIYNVTLQDARDTSRLFSNTSQGFENTKTVVCGLEEYWNYTVSVVTLVMNTDFSTPASDTAFVRTDESAPLEVQNVKVKNIKDICYQLEVSWNAPLERDQNGVIREYVVIATNVKTSVQTIERTSGSVYNKLVSGLSADNTSYSVTVFAVTVSNGSQSPAVVSSTGLCFAEVDEEAAISQVSNISNYEKQYETQFTANISTDVLCDETNGAITQRGIIVLKVSDNVILVSSLEQMSLEQLNSNYTSWAAVKASNFDKAYRATGDTWGLNQCTSTFAISFASYQNATIGSNTDCDPSDTSEYCNGPVLKGSQYRIRLYVCTNAGCSVLPYSGPIYITIAIIPTDVGAIVAGVLVPLIVIGLVIAYLIYAERKTKWPFDKLLASKNKKKQSRGYKDSQEFDSFDDDPETPIKPGPVPIDRFIERTYEMEKNEQLLFLNEFEDLKKYVKKLPDSVARSEANRSKNRYVNILPYDHTRVQLKTTGIDGSDYINANFICGYSGRKDEYIATQGPLEDTKEAFWRMIVEKEVNVIVMLTNIMELGKPKCCQYWPVDVFEEAYGNIKVRVKAERRVGEDYIVRTLEVKQDAIKRDVFHFHFISWPDMGVPESPRNLVDFVLATRRSLNPSRPTPMVVHCSAGVGRTGAFIVVDWMLQQICHENAIDIFETVLKIRNCRMEMVQKAEQFAFIYHCVANAISRNLHVGTRNSVFSDDDNDNLYVNGNGLNNEEPLYANANAFSQNGRSSSYYANPSYNK